MMERPWCRFRREARARERRRLPQVVDSLKVLDPNRPFREADIASPKVREKMFQPLFTTKPGGMGMGLAICKTIVEAHNGTLTALPSKPHGMEFQIVLPLAHIG